MFTQRMAICAALVGAVSLAAMPAFAADDDHDSGFYLGAGLGDFSANYHRPSDVTDQHLTFDRNDTERIFAGWRFNPLSVDSARLVGLRPLEGLGESAGLTTKSDALTPAVIGTLPSSAG